MSDSFKGNDIDNYRDALILLLTKNKIDKFTEPVLLMKDSLGFDSEKLTKIPRCDFFKK